jgi:hypothetical protein
MQVYTHCSDGYIHAFILGAWHGMYTTTRAYDTHPLVTDTR